MRLMASHLLFALSRLLWYARSFVVPWSPSLTLTQMIAVMTAMLFPESLCQKSRNYWSPSATLAKRSLLQMMLKAMRSLRMRRVQIQVTNLTSIRTQAPFLLLKQIGRKSLRHHPRMSPPALALSRVRMRRMNYQTYQNTKQSRFQAQTPARILILTKIVRPRRRKN